MARFQLNQYVDTPFGKLHIYADPEELARAEKLIKDTPHILWDAWKDACERYGKDIVKAAKRCINTGTPPKGASWPPLSPQYLRTVKGDDRIYYKTGQYEDSIGIHKDNVYYTNGKLAKQRYFVGLPLGIRKEPAVPNRKRSPLTLIAVANILELGSPSRNIPPRPLWAPLYEQYGRGERIKRFVRNAIRRQLKKYM